MVNSCVELWLPQFDKMEKKARKASINGHELLKEVFTKHNVNFEVEFKINEWTKKDQEKFVKGMLLLGYKHMINKYMD